MIFCQGVIRMKCKGSKFFLAAAVLCLLAAAPGKAGGAIYRVSVQGSVHGDGSSWGKALHPVNFIEKLEAAREGDEFWVAAGTYAPDIWGGKDARKRSFLLKRGVALYGGFSGKETKRNQRDWKKNRTILTGELQGDKNPTNNSYNVVRVHETADQKTVIDGFFITAGYAIDKPEYPYGGGLLNQGKPTIANCVFEGNHAKSGGAVFAWSRPAISSCIFRNNFASEDGGALAIHLDSPSVTDCTFMDNRASGNGGAVTVYDSKRFLLKNSTFINNHSLSREGGAIYISFSEGTIVNSTFYANAAKWAGGALSTYKSSTLVINCTFYKNRSEIDNQVWGHDVYAGAGADDGKKLRLQNCILWGDGGVRLGVSDKVALAATHCVIQGGFSPGTFIIFGDPRLSPPAENGGPTRTCAIGQSSSAIDNGEPHFAPNKDQRGMPRPAGKGVDIGAYEEQKPVYYPVSGSSKTPDFTVGPSKGKPVQKQPPMLPQKPPQSGASKPSTPVKPVKPGAKPSLPPVKKLPSVKPPAAKPPGIK